MPHEVQPTHVLNFAPLRTIKALNFAPLSPTTSIPRAMPGDYAYMRMCKALILEQSKRRRRARRVVRTFFRTQLQHWFVRRMNARMAICGDDVV